MQPEGNPAEAPAPEAPVAEVPAPVVETAPEAPKSERTLWAEAEAEARAAVEAEAKAPVTPAPDAETPATPTQTPPESREANRRSPEDGALGRALGLRRQGRENELSAAAQKQLADYDEEVSAQAITKYQGEQAKEVEMRQIYLSLEAERMTDPAAYALKLKKNPGIPVFIEAFEAKFPEVSLENPSAPRQRSEADITAELRGEFGRGFERSFDSIAADAGLSDEAIAALKSGFRFDAHPDRDKLGTFMGKMITESVITATSEVKAQNKALEAENLALKQELQAAKIGRISVPSHIPGSSGAPGASSGPTRGSVESRMAEAGREAREALALAGVH